MMVPTLTGARVRLREIAERDADALYPILADPTAMRYWSTLPATSPGDAAAYVARQRSGLADGTTAVWAILLGDDDTALGTIGLHAIDRQSERGEIGYLLARAHWGRGLATEAASLAIDHAFGPMGLRRLEADIDPRNTGSQKLLERLGFQQEGFLRERWRVGDEISDTALYGLLAREWRQPR